MRVKSFKPDPQYLNKLRLIITIVAALFLVSGLLFAWLISTDPDAESGVVTAFIAISIVANLVWWLPGLFLAGAYYRSLSYEIQDDEVIVHVGIWTKTVKHVPYRTVTNLSVERGILDRWVFNLGTLKIQTAGMSGTTGAEESLVGLVDVQEAYDIVATELRRFRGSMAPTGTDIEEDLDAPPQTPHLAPGILKAILLELQAIRQTLDKDL